MFKNTEERHIVTDTVADYLIPENTTRGRFYTIPKVHKATIPMRPIVRGNKTPTEYHNMGISTLHPTIPFYIQDTKGFLKKLTSIKDLPERVLATMDVTSLYTMPIHRKRAWGHGNLHNEALDYWTGKTTSFVDLFMSRLRHS